MRLIKLCLVPFVDLKKQYDNIKTEIDNAIQNVIDETVFIKGKYVNTFEKEYAKQYNVKHCISCGNGTDAIYITLKSLNIGPGDEVILLQTHGYQLQKQFHKQVQSLFL